MMKSEVAKLLTVAAEFDGKSVTAERVELWFTMIGEFEYEDAARAVKGHYLSSEWPLKPVHVVEGVADLHYERAWEPPTLTPDEQKLCIAAGIPAEEFVERRDDTEWVAHLRSKWLGVAQ